MKVVVNVGELRTALASLVKVVPRENVHPILSCVYIRTDSRATDGLYLYTTDLALGVSVGLKAEILQAGSLAIKCRELAKGLVGLNKDATITLETVGDSDCKVITPDGSFNVMGFDANEFPLERVVKGKRFLLPIVPFVSCLQKVIGFCAKTLEKRYYIIAGILVKKEDDRIVFNVTDGYCAVITGMGLETKDFPDKQFVIPQALATVLVDKFKNEKTPKGFLGPKTVDVSVSEESISFAIDGFVFSGDLLQGTFPPVKDIIPTECNTEVCFVVKDFEGVIQKAAKLTNDGIIKLSFGGDGCTVSGTEPEAVFNLKCPVKSVSGDGVDIGIRSAFVLKMLRCCKEDKGIIKTCNPNKPLRFIFANSEYLIMPSGLEK